MKRIFLVTFLVALAGVAAESDRTPLAEFTGEGLVKAPADFITLSITVHSECQENPKAAQASTDMVVKRIDDHLQTLKQEGDEHFKVLIDGGFSTPFSRWYRVGDRDRELCRNTFQKVTTITLKMSVRKDFHEVFANLQDFVLNNFTQGPALDELETPRTFVTLSTPYPEITRENRKRMEEEALDRAVRNAKSNFLAAIKSCKAHPWKIHSIKEGGGEYYPRPAHRFYAAKAAMGRAADSQEAAAPVRFDATEVSKSVNVSFQFNGELCYEENLKR